MKPCSHCREVKPIVAFSRSSARPDGFHCICKVCDAARRKALRESRIEDERARDNARYPTRRDAKRAYDRDYYLKHATRIKADVSEYGRQNRGRLRPLACARSRKRVALKLNATPPWADTQKVNEVYRLAAAMSELTGEPYHVDHIVPLQSKLVCGLHNEFNLRVIPKSENQAKGNRTWPGMP